jgi:hypothetical protein
MLRMSIDSLRCTLSCLPSGRNAFALGHKQNQRWSGRDVPSDALGSFTALGRSAGSKLETPKSRWRALHGSW